MAAVLSFLWKAAVAGECVLSKSSARVSHRLSELRVFFLKFTFTQKTG